jgi:hypothetical protein
VSVVCCASHSPSQPVPSARRSSCIASDQRAVVLRVDINNTGMVKRSPFRHPSIVFSIRPGGGGFKVMSRGLRQPWQLNLRPQRSQPARACPLPGVRQGGRERTTASRSASRSSASTATRRSPGAHPAAAPCVADGYPGRRQDGSTSPCSARIKKRGPEVVAVGISDGTFYAGDLIGTIYRVALCAPLEPGRGRPPDATAHHAARRTACAAK